MNRPNQRNNQKNLKKRQRIRIGSIALSFFLFPATFYYFSPVLIVEAATKGIINGSWICFALMFMVSLFLGRAWCGWLCPAAGCQEHLFSVRNKQVRKGDMLKWLIWLPWTVAIIALAYRAGGYRQINFFYQTVYGFSVTGIESLAVYLLVLFLLIVLPALCFGKRSFCHHLCWMAPFMIIGRKISNAATIPSLRLHADKTKCVGCQKCTHHCPMSLPVDTMVAAGHMENRECILCATCIDTCRQDVIFFRFSGR